MSDIKKKSAPPKLHKFMHPRNPYRTPPSFKKLAVQYPEFRNHCIYELDGKVRLNFKDPNAVRALTTCLLDQDFGLKVSIPDGRLVPTLPLRFNYLLWIEDLLTLSAYHSKERRIISGLDIGCGSACIYPLLASKQFGWCMTATEADDINFNSAVNNVENNQLADQINVRKVADDIVFKSVIDDETVINAVNKSRLKLFKQNHSSLEQEANESKESGNFEDMETEDINYPFDFTMCNPPFFSSEEEADSMSKSKRNRSEPSSASTGALQETVTKGGEVAFITQMINESVMLKDKVRIFTTMIGTKAHVKSAKDALKTVSPAHMSVVEFCQGRTMRWGIAWTFDSNFHLENVMSKKQMVEAKPLTLMLPRSLMSVYTVRAAWTMINKWLHQLKITVQLFKNTKYFVGAQIKAYKPTWAHQRRKRREQKRKEASQGKNGKETDKAEGETQIINQDREYLKRTTDDTEDIPVLKRQKYLESDDAQARSSSKEISLGDVQESHVEQEESPDSKKPNIESPQTMDCTESNAIPKEEEGSSQQEVLKGLECILKAKIHLKQSGGLISLEAFYLRGSYGKDGLNQLLQYMKNLLTNPSSE